MVVTPQSTIDSSLVGQEIACVRFPIDRSKVAELAAALWDDRATWREAGPTDHSGQSHLALPPTVTVLADNWRDGGALAHANAIGADVERLLHGEAVWDYYAPLHLGDEVTARTSVTEVTRRTGRRGGPMTFIRLETTFEKGSGAVVARRSDLLIETAT